MDQKVVAGRRFQTKADYDAALRDQKKIEQIKSHTDLNNPKQIFQLFSELQSGVYRFETIIGTDFDDEIYEKIEDFRNKGIHSGNADQYIEDRKKKSKIKKSKKVVREKKEKVFSKNTAHKKSSYLDISQNKDLDKQIQIEFAKREKRRKLIVLLSSLVAVGCFTYFGIYYYMYARTSARYEELASLKNSSALSENNDVNTFSLHKQSVKTPDILDEYKTLYQKNKKLIGWLKIDDTNIDYPVMQTNDNEYYLEHNFNQEYDKNGSLFLDYQCEIFPRSTNLIVYGHHMKSGQMFGGLQKFAKESYGKKHPYIQFDSIYEKATYQVMYVFRSQVFNEDDLVFKYYQFINANSEKEFNSYMKEMAELSLYDTGVTASYGDSLLTLSTCDNSQTDGRFAVVAKRIQ